VRCDIVSIVIPCYNGERYLAQAIESCLRQTLRAIEVIVVDDASPDGCAAIAERYAGVDDRVRLIRRAQNGGVSRAFNTGFEAARGEYLTRLAQDDRFGEEALAAMRSRLLARPEAGLTYCDYATIDEHDTVVGEVSVPEPAAALVPRNAMGLCVMWRRAVWEVIGGFDSRFDTAEDYEYWLRASAIFPIVRCQGRGLFFSRHHEDMGSHRFYARQEQATLAALRAALAGETPRQKRALHKAMARALVSAAYDYSAAGHHGEALSRLLRSFVLWPRPFRRGEFRTPLARLKALLVFTRRALAQCVTAPRSVLTGDHSCPNPSRSEGSAGVPSPGPMSLRSPSSTSS
jgi:glycosyltransferase involved in cell wall biosynthesis